MKQWSLTIQTLLLSFVFTGHLFAQQNSPFGVVVAEGIYGDECRLNDVRALGLGWVRASFSWHQIEVQQDRFEWAQADQLVQQLASRGIWIYWDFSYAPCWANGRPCYDGPYGPGTLTRDPDRVYPPLSQADLRQYVTQVVTRYRDYNIYWGAWNEADRTEFYKGGGNGQRNISRYTKNELQTIVNAIRDADPQARIVVGELSSHVQHDQNLLRQVLDAVSGKFNVISLHIYNEDNSCGARLGALDRFYTSIRSWGHGANPIWVTETGGGVDDFGSIGKQNKYLACFWQAMQQRPWWKKSFWYRYEYEPSLTGLLDGGPAACTYHPNSTYYVYQSQITAWPALPLPPSGLSASAGDSRVNLTWTAGTGATSYNVKRSVIPGGPYAVIGSNILGTQFADSTAQNGRTYYYVVSSQNSGGESLDSSEAVATPGSSGGVNLVRNPSFERGNEGDAFNWTETVNQERASDNAADGSWSLRSTFSGPGGVASLSAPISVTRNTNYTFSARIYRTGSVGNAYVDMGDISGEVQLVSTGQTGVWQQLSETWNSGDVTTVTLRCVTDGGINSAVWFDSISLVAR